MTMWDAAQQVQLRTLRKVVHMSEDAQLDLHQRQADEIAELEEDIDRLVLLTEVLWTLLRDRLGVTEAELKATIEALDSVDGVIDGRRAAVSPGRCASCDAVVPAGMATCQFCGHASGVAPDPFAR